MRDVRLHRSERPRRHLVGIQIFDEPVGGNHQAAFCDQPGRAGPGTPAELRASVSELGEMLDEHIADKEGQLFPAMRRYLTADAHRWCERQIQRTASQPGLRFTAPWLARYAQPDELSLRLAGGGWPARILLTATRRGYARLERQAFPASPARPATPATRQPHMPITTRRRS